MRRRGLGSSGDNIPGQPLLSSHLSNTNSWALTQYTPTTGKHDRYGDNTATVTEETIGRPSRSSAFIHSLTVVLCDQHSSLPRPPSLCALRTRASIRPPFYRPNPTTCDAGPSAAIKPRARKATIGLIANNPSPLHPSSSAASRITGGKMHARGQQ